MSRLFNVEVFNQVISGDATTPPLYRSGAEFYSLLGSAELLMVQVSVDMVQSAGTVVTVGWEITNILEEAQWGGGFTAKTLPAVGPTTVPVGRGFSISAHTVNISTGASASDIGGYGRFVVSAKPDTARVRIVVAGYSC